METHQKVLSILDNILVIIPVRNEESTIAHVIDDLRSYGLTKIRVVDNGSDDRSGAIANATGVEVIQEPTPGYGQACWRGLQQLPPGIEWILFCDGDGSDDLQVLPIWFAQRAHYDLMLGDRRGTAAGRAALTPIQRFGNRLATRLIRWGWGYGYNDLGPLRMIRQKILTDFKMQDRGFGWTVEMQIKAVEADCRICEQPVNYRPRQGGDSKISGTIMGSGRAGWVILRTLAQHYLDYQRRQGRDRSLLKTLKR